MRIERIIDMGLVVVAIALFYAGVGIGSSAYGFTNFTTQNLTITGNLYVRGDIGDAPTDNAILLFNTSCPTGWVRQTQYDNAYPRGNDTYNGASLGSATHTHPIASHTHSGSSYGVTEGEDNHNHAFSMSTSADGTHNHQQSGTSDTPNGGDLTGACNGYWTGTDADHQHSFSGTTSDSYSTHSMAGTSGASTGALAATSSDPPYVTLVFCSKA